MATVPLKRKKKRKKCFSY